MGLPGSGKTTLSKKLANLTNSVWLNADIIRTESNDWDFSPQGRIRQANRMKKKAQSYTNDQKNIIADFVCPTKKTRVDFNSDYTVWMDTINAGRFVDTNAIFEIPPNCDYHVGKWFTDTPAQLMPVVQRWMEKNNV